MSRLWSVLVLVVALFAFPLAAAAETETARSCYEKGLSAFALANYATAAMWYEKAFDLKPDPALLYNAAQSHRLAGNKQRALALYENYLRVFRGQVSNELEVKRHIRELEKAIRSDKRVVKSPPLTTATVRGESNPQEEATPEPSTPAPSESAGPRLNPDKDAAKVAAAAPTPATDVTHSELPDNRPAFQKPWFWGVMAAAIVVVGVGLGVGLGLGLHPGSPAITLGKVQAQ